MDADRIIEAVRRHLVRPGLTIERRKDWPDQVSFRTSWYAYTAQPADWRVSRESWVDEAVRVTAEGGTEWTARNYGFLFGRNGEEWFLNDVEVIRELGRRLGDDLDPIDYAELLAAFYSAGDIDRPVVEPLSVHEGMPAGELVTDVDAFAERYPYADPSLVAPPRVENSNGETSVKFFSYHQFFCEYGSTVDVLKWTVTGGGGRPVEWSREYVAKRLTRP
ncbi:hypothetical protein [Micromonospora zhanjiangensis]|uniref:Uncharacterized protein n=1 Tax=Micromonospora zhanjiangensis TaxID=1522057 RepID=A0ABV8KNN8_9ACTN